MVVAALYQLHKQNGKVDSNDRKLITPDKVVSLEWVKRTNHYCADSLKFYVINDEKTREWEEDKKLALEIKAEEQKQAKVLSLANIAQLAKVSLQEASAAINTKGGSNVDK
jgi:Fic family protein